MLKLKSMEKHYPRCDACTHEAQHVIAVSAMVTVYEATQLNLAGTIARERTMSVNFCAGCLRDALLTIERAAQASA